MGKLWNFLKLVRQTDLEENRDLSVSQKLTKGLAYLGAYVLALVVLLPGIVAWWMSFVMIVVNLMAATDAPFPAMPSERVSVMLNNWTWVVNLLMLVWIIISPLIVVYADERYKTIWKKNAGEAVGAIPKMRLLPMFGRSLVWAGLPIIFAVIWNLNFNMFQNSMVLKDTRDRIVPVFCERTTVYAKENLEKLRNAVKKYNKKKGHYPNEIYNLIPNYIESIPTLWIYRHEPTRGVLTVKEAKELEDSGKWCYSSKTGKVKILCTHKIKGEFPGEW